MTHLKIEQNNGITEQVSPSVIEKLYEIVYSGNLDSSSNLMGSLNTTSTYLNYVDYLEELFTKNGVRLLIITANKLYIYFADPEVTSYWANSTYGDGTGIDSTNAATVLNIPNNAFKNNTSVETFDELGRCFPNCTTINSYAFNGCTNLTDIDLHNIISIGNNAFDSCSSLTTIDLSNCTSIDNYTFNNCSSLTTVDNTSNITSIGNKTFLNCLALTSIDLSNITSIGEGTFANCSSLTNIDLSNVTSIGRGSFSGCSELTSVGDTSNVTSVGSYTFASCSSLTNIDLPNVTTIDGRAFLNCTSLISIDNLSNCTSIGDNAFNGCTALTTIDLSNVTSIDHDIFYGCSSLASVGDLSNVTSISYRAFNNCSSLTTVDLSNCISIGDSAFNGCNKLTSVDLSSCTSIGSLTFSNCSLLTTVSNTSNVTSISDRAFLDCLKLTTINLPNCTSISNSAFRGCTLLTSINLPNCTSIDYYTFYGCSALTTFDFSNITSVGASAFNGCTSLGTGQTLDLNLSNLTSYPEHAFRETAYSKLILHCPLLTGTMDTRYPIWYGMPNVTYIDLSDFLIPKSVFNNSQYECPGPERDTSIVTFIYSSNVTYIGTSINYGRLYNTYRYAIILATTPPGINKTDSNNPPSTWFMNSNLHIYVPDSAKASYLADADWATIGGYNGSDTITDRLHGLSELPNGVWTTGLASLYLTPAQLATS